MSNKFITNATLAAQPEKTIWWQWHLWHSVQ